MPRSAAGPTGCAAARCSCLLVAAAGCLAVAAVVGPPGRHWSLVAVFYGLYLAVLVVAEARLQDRIASAHRATITSVAGLGIELASLLVFAAWALGGAGRGRRPRAGRRPGRPRRTADQGAV